jgi:hypothetical protein
MDEWGPTKAFPSGIMMQRRRAGLGGSTTGFLSATLNANLCQY